MGANPMNINHTHTYLTARSPRYAAAAEYTVDLVDKARDDERGITTTEVAILTFIAVTVATGLGAILWAAVKSRADQIEDVEMPTIGE